MSELTDLMDLPPCETFLMVRPPSCDTCATQGRSAPCHGQEGCHGYLNGCDCPGCLEAEEQIAASAAAPAAAPRAIAEGAAGGKPVGGKPGR